MDLVVDAEKGHNFFKVFFVLVSSSTIPNAWSVDKVELGNVCLKHILPRGLGSRPTGGENFICIRTKANFRPFPFLIRIGKPGINRPFYCQNNVYFDLMYYDVSLQAVLMTEVWIFLTGTWLCLKSLNFTRQNCVVQTQKQFYLSYFSNISILLISKTQHIDKKRRHE